jgi:superfamily I DNA/RNA helicase
MSWDENLEGPALEFAAAAESSIRALAGPGTGKTFALLRRVARLLEEGCDGKTLLVVTFARTAAQDLIRALQELEYGGAGNVKAGTLHSFCFSMLSHEGVLKATARYPRILLDFERDILLLDLEGPFSAGKTDRDDLRKAFEAAWARLQTEEPGEPVRGLDQRFQDSLLASLRWHRAMLIGEVIPISLSYLRNNPQAEERSAFTHVLVDEYQDLNKAEQSVVDLLSAKGSLTVIGDDDQSIYGLKSANPEGIRTFNATHPGTYDVEFVECRRCPQIVVDMAQALIQRNPGRIRSALHARHGNPPGEVHNVQWTSIQEEADGIADFIESRVACGVEPGQCLILAPSRHVGYAIRDSVRKKGIEIGSSFREEAVESENAQRALTLLTLLSRPNDRVALRAWLSFGSTTQRRGPYRRVYRKASETGTDIADVLRSIEAGQLELPYTSTLVESWLDLHAQLAELAPLTEDLGSLCETLFPRSTNALEEDEFALIRDVAEECAEESDSLSRLVELLRYRIALPAVPLRTPYARVMSFHKSKGLTADLVVLAGLIQGSIPRIKEKLSLTERQAALEEQRRLFFVALTRTTNVLVFSSYSALDFHTAKRLGAKIGSRLLSRPGKQENLCRVFATQFLSELGAGLPRAIRGEDWAY